MSSSRVLVPSRAFAANATSSFDKSAMTLPRIQAHIGHIPQKLKTSGVEPNRRARLEVLRKIITRVVREERIEMQWNRAIEARPYLERLIQLGVEKGPTDEYTAEMVEWWLPEAGLPYKLYEIVPRFASSPAPFTSIYRLPSKRLENYVQNKRVFWKRYDIGVLEIDGNPYPPVIDEPTEHGHTILNQVLRRALRDRLEEAERQAKKAQ